MGISTYKKKIEAYVKSKEGVSKPKDGEVSKGLLAPKSPMEKATPAGSEQDAVTNVGEFIYALRQKRREFQLKNKGAK
jgi:hypothetical protein